MDKVQILFQLLQSEICQTPLTPSIKDYITPEIKEQIYKLSKAHDLAHIAANALDRLGLLGGDEVSAKFQKQQMLAVYRYNQIQHELDAICRVLEEAEIFFLPLKGSVLRDYYPEPWMRTSCDIDILVAEKDLENAASVLEAKLQYSLKAKQSHDWQIFAPNGVHLELHYTLIEEDYFSACNPILNDVWKHAVPKESNRFHLLMSDEMFYFHHIVHMAKHFKEGGCGIRPFLDLWILEHRVPFDANKRNILLEQAQMRTFADCARALSEMWFSGVPANPTSQQMQSFILTGGVYGTMQNRVSIQQTQKGGKLRFIVSRIFPPYNVIKFHFPVLQKHKWLLPVMYVCRWFRLLFRGKIKRGMRELNASQSISKEQTDQTQEFLSEIGL